MRQILSGFGGGRELEGVVEMEGRWRMSAFVLCPSVGSQ